MPECCAEARFLTRDWALNQPTCYVTVDPRAGKEHFLREPWLHRASSAELACGQAILRRTLGLPIQRDDVIETCSWQGQRQSEYGYRLNPRTVIARSCQMLGEAVPARDVLS